MNPLPETKSVDGMQLTLLARIGDYALISTKTSEGSHESGFEVHRIKFQAESMSEIAGRVIKRREQELYRSAREFGFHAWAYPNLEEVYKDFPQFKDSQSLWGRY